LIGPEIVGASRSPSSRTLDTSPATSSVQEPVNSRGRVRSLRSLDRFRRQDRCGRSCPASGESWIRPSQRCRDLGLRGGLRCGDWLGCRGLNEWRRRDGFDRRPVHRPPNIP